MPGVRTLAIVGVITASSRAELLGANASKRDYFVTPRCRPDSGVLFVSAPFKSPLGLLVIGLSRALTNAQDEFAGVVLAALDPRYFEVVLRSVLHAPHMRASIARGEGQFFVTMPVNAQMLVVNLARPGVDIQPAPAKRADRNFDDRAGLGGGRRSHGCPAHHRSSRPSHGQAPRGIRRTGVVGHLPSVAQSGAALRARLRVGCPHIESGPVFQPAGRDVKATSRSAALAASLRWVAVSM
jgi:hypothetical protein